MSLGSSIDADDGTLQNTGADADDTLGTTGDDDGLIIANLDTLTNTATTYTINNIGVTNSTGSDATLIGWIDFDGNGSFEADEATSATFGNVASASLTWNNIPTDITPGDTYARFRLSSDFNGITIDYTTSLGSASDGEVEDYQISIETVDYGDAPDISGSIGAGDYQTTEANDRAAHIITNGLSLGSQIDADDGTLQDSDTAADDIAGSVGQLYYEYYDFASAPVSVDEIPNSGADAAGTVDPNTNLLSQSDQGDTSNFGIRYFGSIYIGTPGTYTFYTTSDDGSTLAIDNNLVVINDEVQSVATKSGTYTFDTAGYYPIEVECFQNVNTQSLTLEYESTDAGITRQEIPASVFYTNDEDGVDNLEILTNTATSYSVEVDVTNALGGAANLIGWIDFDGDGQFEIQEASNIISNITTSGTQTLTWSGLDTLPGGITAGSTYARFRLSTDSLTDASSTGTVSDGEVEERLSDRNHRS